MDGGAIFSAGAALLHPLLGRGLQWNQGPEAIRAFRNGRTRFTYTLTLDARLQKGFTIGARHVVVMVDGYNKAKEVEEFPITGPTSRLTAAVQPPRALHVGLRVAF